MKGLTASPQPDVEKAGLPGVQFHDLRQRAATETNVTSDRLLLAASIEDTLIPGGFQRR